MPGMVELGEDIFLKPVRRGNPKYIGALSDMVAAVAPVVDSGAGVRGFRRSYMKRQPAGTGARHRPGAMAHAGAPEGAIGRRPIGKAETGATPLASRLLVSS